MIKCLPCNTHILQKEYIKVEGNLLGKILKKKVRVITSTVKFMEEYQSRSLGL